MRLSVRIVCIFLIVLRIVECEECELWPSDPRHMSTLILVDRRLVKLCFDPWAKEEEVFLRTQAFVQRHGVFGDSDTVMRIANACLRKKWQRWKPSGLRLETGPLKAVVEFDLGCGQTECLIQANAGDSTLFASYKACKALIESDILSLGEDKKCQREISKEIGRLRGLHTSFGSGGHNDYNRLRVDLEAYIFANTSMKTAIEGGTMHYAFKLHAMRSLLDALLETLDQVHVCEIGFNMGHSSLLWLTHSPRVRVSSFDLQQNSYSVPAAQFLMSVFSGEENKKRFHITWGNSRQTLAENPPSNCNLIFVDGGHDFETALCDLWNLRLSIPTTTKTQQNSFDKTHLILLDDANFPLVAQAWHNATNAGWILHDGDIFEDAHFDSPYLARSSMLFGSYSRLHEKQEPSAQLKNQPDSHLLYCENNHVLPISAVMDICARF